MDWKDYEDQVFEILSTQHRHDYITKNYKIKGRYSNRSRQIDIFIKINTKVGDSTIVVDCKHYNKKINIKTVESFISMIDDIGADYGIIISDLGYTKSAIHRAFNNPKGVELDIFSLNELYDYMHAESAMPYAGDNMALILAPFGWIVDGKKRDIPAVCHLYKRGLTFEEALASGEFAYVNFWKSDDPNFSIEELSRIQEKNILNIYNQKIDKVEFYDAECKFGQDAKIRIIKTANYPFIEITGFIKFSDSIFFYVCNSLPLYEKRNLRKTHVFLKNALPFKVNISHG
ncbi:restriction endonuclease [Haliscomenobacter sp.]|uniref:restriction endonuclease n=1 Tax=Haliscomenobacter sp. TaxID=2717303 RepID=UPI003BAC8991